MQVYRVSPVLRHRFGGFAVGELRYTLGQFLVDSDQASNTTAHTGQATLASGYDFDRVRWALNNRVSKAIRSGSSNIEQADSLLEAEYGLTRWLSAIVARRLSAVRCRRGRRGLRQPRVFRRLPLAAGAANRAGAHLRQARRPLQPGRGAHLSDHRELPPRRELRRRPQHAQQRLSTNLSSIGIDRDTDQFIDERAGTPFDPRADPFNIDDEIVYIKAARVALGFARGRNAFGVQGYFGREETVDTGEEEEIYRADATWSRRLGRRLSFDSLRGLRAHQICHGPR